MCCASKERWKNGKCNKNKICESKVLRRSRAEPNMPISSCSISFLINSTCSLYANTHLRAIPVAANSMAIIDNLSLDFICASHTYNFRYLSLLCDDDDDDDEEDGHAPISFARTYVFVLYSLFLCNIVKINSNVIASRTQKSHWNWREDKKYATLFTRFFLSFFLSFFVYLLLISFGDAKLVGVSFASFSSISACCSFSFSPLKSSNGASLIKTEDVFGNHCRLLSASIEWNETMQHTIVSIARQPHMYARAHINIRSISSKSSSECASRARYAHTKRKSSSASSLPMEREKI